MANRTADDDAQYFEALYQASTDPWDYAQAAEQAKYQITLDAARRWRAAPRRVLDAGCSLGYLTNLLGGYAPEVSAIDISETAVRWTQERCARHPSGTKYEIRVGDVLAPDFALQSFDVIFAGDVLQGAFESSPRAVQAVEALLPLLSSGGILIVADFLHPSQQRDYVKLVESGGARVLEKIYFNDRYWFRLKGALKGFRKSSFGQRMLRSKRVHQFLARRAARLGPQGSKHFGLVVEPNV